MEFAQKATDFCILLLQGGYFATAPFDVGANEVLYPLCYDGCLHDENVYRIKWFCMAAIDEIHFI